MLCAFASFIAATFATLSLNYRYNASVYGTIVMLSGGALTGIITGGTLLILALVLTKIEEGKTVLTAKNIASLVISAITLGLTVAIVVLASTNFVMFQTGIGDNKLSSATFMAFVYQLTSDAYGLDVTTLTVLSPVCFALSVATITLAAIVLALVLCRLFCPNQKRVLPFSIALFGCAIAYVVLGIVTVSEILFENLNGILGASVGGLIAVIVLAVLALSCAVVQCVLHRKAAYGE